MIVQEIKAALEAMKQDEEHYCGAAYNEATNDCLAYTSLPVQALEGYFDSCLWFADDVGFDEAYPTEEDRAYAIALGHIEEYLLGKGLIYQD